MPIPPAVADANGLIINHLGPTMNRVVVAIELPKGIESHALRSYMTDTFHVEISGAFGLPIVRIGQMGEQCRSYNLFRVLYAMGMSFKHFGVDLNISKGMAHLAKDDKHFVR